MKPVFFDSPAAFRTWLSAHHPTHREQWVGFHKRHTGRPSLTWPQSVDEALCFGWIDGLRKSLGETSYMIRFTPRKPTSIWSAINIRRVAELETEGRMTDAGRRAFELRSTKKSAVYSYERKTAAALSPAQLRALKANRAAWAWFSARPPWYQRAATHWVVSARQPATRERRLLALIADSEAERLVKPLRLVSAKK